MLETFMDFDYMLRTKKSRGEWWATLAVLLDAYTWLAHGVARSSEPVVGEKAQEFVDLIEGEGGLRDHCNAAYFIWASRTGDSMSLFLAPNETLPKDITFNERGLRQGIGGLLAFADTIVRPVAVCLGAEGFQSTVALLERGNRLASELAEQAILAGHATSWVGEFEHEVEEQAA